MNNGDEEKIPQYVIESLARLMLPEIQKFYESERGKDFYNNIKQAKEKNEVKPERA